MTVITVIDVETTGLTPEADRVVEIAAVEVRQTVEPSIWLVGAEAASFVNPRIPVPLEATAVHHIVDADLVGAPDLGEAIDRVMTPMWRDTVDVIAGHNCRFDREFLPPLRDKRWLDTWRCAMHVWPDAPSFGNAVLFYWLGHERLPLIRSHSASFDARMTAAILCRLLKERTVEELLKLSRKAVVLKKVGFGKHFGALWTDVPDSYLSWASGVKDMDPDVKFTIKTEIARRAAL